MAEQASEGQRLAARQAARQRFIEKHLADVHPAFSSDLPVTDDAAELEAAGLEIRRRWRIHQAERAKLKEWESSFFRRRK